MGAVYIRQCCAVMYYLAALQGFFVFEMRCVAVALLIAFCLFHAREPSHSLSLFPHVHRWGGSFIHSHDVVVLSFLPPSV